MKKQNKIIIGLIGVMILTAFAFTQMENTKEFIAEVDVLPEKDAVDIYMDQRRAETDEDLRVEEALLRETLEMENAHVELQEDFYDMRTAYASSTDKMIGRMGLISAMDLSDEYDAIATAMGIKTITK